MFEKECLQVLLLQVHTDEAFHKGEMRSLLEIEFVDNELFTCKLKWIWLFETQ